MNDPVDRRPRLEELAFFAGFDPEFLARAAEGARERVFETGELLAREGDPAEVLFFLRGGKVALEAMAADRPRRTVQTLGAGDLVGWSWLVPPHRWRFDARALKPTPAVVLDAPVLRAVLAERPADGYRFLLRMLPIIAQRLEHTRLQLLDLHAP